MSRVFRAPLVVAAIALVSLAGVDLSALPTIETRLAPRLTEVRCVLFDGNGQPVDVQPTAEDGSCAPGYETMPWT